MSETPEARGQRPGGTFSDAVAAVLIRHRVLVLLAAVAATVWLAFPLRDLRVDYDVTSFLSSEEPTLRAAAEHYGEFDVPDNLLLFCYPEDDPYSFEAQDRLDEFDRAVSNLPGVERVLTMASAPGLGRAYGDRLRDRIQNSHTWRNLLVSKRDDALGGMIVLERDGATPDERSRLFAAIRALPEAEGLDLNLAGLPFHRYSVISMIRDDQAFFIPVAAAICGVLLLWFIPSLIMAALCLVVVPCTMVATLGTMAAAGFSLTLLTSALPMLIMCMAVAGGVHLVGRFIEERSRGLEPVDAARAMTARLLFPCLLTALTTAAGFLSLTFTTIPDLRHLGWFAALGVGYALVFTLALIPPSLSFVRSMPASVRFDLPGGFARMAGRLAALRPAAVLVPAGLALAVASYSAWQVRIDNHLLDDLWPDSPVAQQLSYYQDRFINMAPSEVLVTSEAGFGDETSRQEIDDLVTWLESNPVVDRSVSIVDLIRDDMPMWLVRSMGGLGGLLSRDGKTARVLVFQADEGNRYLAGFRESVREHGRRYSRLDVRVAGVRVIATTLVDRLTGALAQSFGGSLLVILCLIWWHFRSLRLGLIAMVPNLFPLVVNLGFISALDMELRPLTVISFCVAFGLAVDDTVHLLARYREERRAGTGFVPALRRMLETAGRPVVVTTLLLLVGFLVILSSSFKGTFQFGALVALALTGSLLGAMFLLPALVRVTGRWEREVA